MSTFDIPNPLAEESRTLIPLPREADWKSYGQILRDTESALIRLYAEADSALAMVDQVSTLADGTLESSESSLKDLTSKIQSASSALGINQIPTTGNSYTHFVADNFQNTSVQDQSIILGREPLTLSIAAGDVLACPSRPSLEIDSVRQILRLREESHVEVFQGLPGTGAYLEKVHGTILAEDPTWDLSVASRYPLTILDPLDPWIPATYDGGLCARLKIHLENPSPLTEVHLRGSGALLETVCAIDSRSNPLSAGSHPQRALNAGWHGSLTGANLTVTGTSRWAPAPDRNPADYTGGINSALDYALILHGRVTLTIPVSQHHTILRYRAYCPQGNPFDSQSPPSGNPLPPETTYVLAEYYSQTTPTPGVDSPLSREVFRDKYLHALGFGGAPSFTHLLSLPSGASSVVLTLGTDPGIDLHTDSAGGEIAYSDVWLCDEAVTQTFSEPLPSPASSASPGTHLTSADLQASLGNPGGLLAFSDVWITLGQSQAQMTTATPLVGKTPSKYTPPLSALPFDGADPLPLRWEANDDVRSQDKSYEHTSISPFRRLFGREYASRNNYLALRQSRARSRPVPQSEEKTESIGDSSGHYVYTLSLQNISLQRRQYASSGLYLTSPLQEIGGFSGEIREVGIVTDPPLPALGDRIRLWVIPDSEVLVGTGQDSSTSLLARAVPLDRHRPRATFHCTSEGLAGVLPASSDVADSWKAQGGLPSYPAFSIPPSQASETSIGLPAFQSSLRLGHIPYINREAIREISASLSSGTALLPGEYDPNAIRPLASLVTGGTYKLGGYRPVTLSLKMPNGALVLPDSLGKPRPGEILYSGYEILQEAADVSSAHLPSDPNTYTYSSTTDLASANRARITFSRAYTTAHAPIASGAQGASISLFWHKSSDFDASKGGILTSYDVQIPSSNYDVDSLSGSIRVRDNPPGSWADYDQIVAQYFWRVGSLAAREVFPPPDLTALYTPYDPYVVDPVSGVGSGIAPYKPTQPILQGYVDTSTLLADPSFAQNQQYWTSFGKNAPNNELWQNFKGSPVDIKIGKYVGYGSGANWFHFISTKNFWCADDASEGVYQAFKYPGPGTANISLWHGYNTSMGFWPRDRPYHLILEVIDNSGTVVESQDFQFDVVQKGTVSLPCLYGSQTDPTNLTTSPPWWFPTPTAQYPTVNWPGFKASLVAGNEQTVYQWPSDHMTTITLPSGASGYAVASSFGGVPGTTVDNITTFAVVKTSRVEAPYAVQVPFVTPKTAGMTLKVTTRAVNGNNDSNGIIGVRTDVWWTTPNFQQGCIPPYYYDAATDSCKYQNPNVTLPPDAGTLVPVPSDLADLLALSLQQSYPVTRNVTDYENGAVSTLRPVNMDPLSPDYYPVFEYRIDSGGIPVLANDFTDIGPYAGTELIWKYDYLDVSPRFVLEILPQGLTALNLPSTPDPGQQSLNTPEINSLYLLVNART